MKTNRDKTFSPEGVCRILLRTGLISADQKDDILKNILREDPDIIMIGEMRDLETAENAIQAAPTGHLVLSTLHTNDALSAMTRLLDLGIAPFLIRATLIGVVAQRLVRKICVHCKEPFDIGCAELASMGLDTGREGTVRLFRGRGCLRCRGTGYLGRTGIYEATVKWRPHVTERIKAPSFVSVCRHINLV